ncbi:MAG: protease HtpX [Nitrospira sp.]|nr:protease HtpX [Nitrospira sp.]
MKWMKGIGLLLISNLLIGVALFVVFNVLAYVVLPAFGIDIRGSINDMMLLYAFVLGMGGAFLSLAFSKQMARAMLHCTQITQPRTHAEQVIYGSIQEIARRLEIKMPEIWVYDSPDPNAFATGPSKNNAMVAVSTGLLNNLNEKEVRAVLAHEMGHVFNGDMFTTTVLAGLMNTFVYFIAMWVRRLFAERDQAMLGFVVSIVLEIALGILAMLVINWYSRKREFQADAFSAKVYGKDSMIAALQGIDRWMNRAQMEYAPQDALATMKIAGKSGGLMSLFATHPPIEARIAALQRL